MWSSSVRLKSWSHLSGNSTSNQYGVYETKGTVSPKNWPSSRFGMSLFVDAKTRALYLIGGTGCIQGICAGLDLMALTTQFISHDFSSTQRFLVF